MEYIVVTEGAAFAPEQNITLGKTFRPKMHYLSRCTHLAEDSFLVPLRFKIQVDLTINHRRVADGVLVARGMGQTVATMSIYI